MSSNKEPVTPPATTARNTGTTIKKPRKTTRGKTQQDSEAESSGHVLTHDASAEEPGDNNDTDTQTMMRLMMSMQLQLMELQLTLLQNPIDTGQGRQPTQQQPFDMPPRSGSKQISIPPPTMRPEEPTSAVRRTQQADLASLPPPGEDLKKFDMNLNEHPYDKNAQEEVSTPPSDNDSSSDEYNYMSVDSGSDTDIGYETDITEDDTDIDADEDGTSDGNHDTSDFAELFDDNEDSLNYPTSGPIVPPPQVIDNGATTETTITHDIGGNSTSIPNTYLLPTQFPTTTDDKVDDTDTKLRPKKGYKLATVVEKKITLEIIGIPNSYNEALTSKHNEKWKVAMAKEMDCWHFVFRSGQPKGLLGLRPIPGRWTITSL